MRRYLLSAIVLALAGCEDTTVKPEAAPATTEATTNSVQQEAQRSAATAPSTTRATVPAVTEGPLGTTFTVSPGDRKITAYTFRPVVTSPNQFTQPKPGMVFAAAEVQECAGPAGERFSPNRFDFELAMADNTRAQPGIHVQQPELASSPLLPGDCIRGWVTFDVPGSATITHVVYSSGVARAKWRVTP